MSSGLGDAQDHPGEKVERIERLGGSKAKIPLAAIDHLAQALVKRHSLEADGWVQEVTSQAFHFFMIFGLHRDPVVNGESAVLPRIEQLDTLVGE